MQIYSIDLNSLGKNIVKIYLNPKFHFELGKSKMQKMMNIPDHHFLLLTIKSTL